MFDKYFDYAADAPTFELEITPLDEFQQLLELLDREDYVPLFDLIRNVWDIAYTYGYQDAQADAGLDLSEQED